MIESFTDIDIVVLHKMIFIYNAVMKGWCIEKIGPTEISFTKSSDRCTINLAEFINNNLTIPDKWQNILKE